MDSIDTEVAFEFPPLFRIFKAGRVERFVGTEIVPPSTDPVTGVQSKDVVISPETGVSARLFLPKTLVPNQKVPLLFYIHGGAFCIESPFSPGYHNHLNSFISKSNAIAVSVNYRLAPEHPVPTGHDDTWKAIQWVASHCNGDGPEPWLNQHADLSRVFMAGDSAGANIANDVAIRAGTIGLAGVNLVGMILIHPFFGNGEPDKLWEFINPTTIGVDDPMLDPRKDPRLAKLGCARVLILIAEKDFLRQRGLGYHEALRKSGWDGAVELVETEGEGHVFHLFNPGCEKAGLLLDKMVSFVNQD